MQPCPSALDTSTCVAGFDPLQMLLRVGIMKAQQQPTKMHPYGYARDQFIWPLISAVGIFCCGAGVSFVHGVTGLLEAHRELGDLYWNFVGESVCVCVSSTHQVPG